MLVFLLILGRFMYQRRFLGMRRPEDSKKRDQKTSQGFLLDVKALSRQPLSYLESLRRL